MYQLSLAKKDENAKNVSKIDNYLENFVCETVHFLIAIGIKKAYIPIVIITSNTHLIHLPKSCTPVPSKDNWRPLMYVCVAIHFWFFKA